MTRTINHAATILDQFSQQADGYSRLVSAPAAGLDRAAAFRALFSPTQQDQVLDVCCGPGPLALDVAPHVAHVTGVDVTPAMLDRARSAQARKGIHNVDWMSGDIYDLPFNNAAFSLVLCGAAFHHLQYPKNAFAELVRVCRAGGRIAVRDVTPAPDTAQAYDRMETLRDPSHVHALTPDELRALGDGMQVDLMALEQSVSADFPLDPILAASFPTACSIGDIRAAFLKDAEAGTNTLGFCARFVAGELCVSYPMSTAMWIRR